MACLVKTSKDYAVKKRLKTVVQYSNTKYDVYDITLHLMQLLQQLLMLGNTFHLALSRAL